MRGDLLAETPAMCGNVPLTHIKLVGGNILFAAEDEQRRPVGRLDNSIVALNVLYRGVTSAQSSCISPSRSRAGRIVRNLP